MVDLRESWSIGPVEIPTRLVLAPMAGVSVQAFRRQGRRFGAGLVCSEMVSCAGIEHRNERTLGYLRVARDEHPLAIQLFGSSPETMSEAARSVREAKAASKISHPHAVSVTDFGEAENGAQAIEMVGRCQPDLLLVDISLPDMNGLATLRALLRVKPSLRACFLTRGDIEGQFVSPTNRCVLFNPYTMGDLGRCMQEALSASRAGS